MRLFWLLVLIKVSCELSFPVELVDRVEFWFKVFIEYSQHQKVVHHRWFPQCVFGVLDFRAEAQIYSSESLERFINSQEAAYVDKVYAVLSKLAEGKVPSTPFENHIFSSFKRCVETKRKGSIKWTLTERLIRTQSGLKEKTKRAIQASGAYLPYIKQTLKSYGLPEEISYLPLLESHFNIKAVSKVGAAGLWQFMPATAKSYGLRLNKYVDERFDPFLSTHAACRYLLDAYNVLNSWPAALISYNHGVAGLRRKISEHFGAFDLIKIIENPTQRVLGFASTNFYPSFLAVVKIYKNLDSLDSSIKLDPPLNVQKVYLPKPINFNSLPKMTNVNLSLLKDLNQHLSSFVLKGSLKLPAHYHIYLPQGVKVDWSLEQMIKKPKAKPSPVPKPKPKR